MGLGHRTDDPGRGVPVRQVGCQRRDPGPLEGQVRSRPVYGQHPRPLRGEQLGAGTADTGGGPGDDGDLVLQAVHGHSRIRMTGPVVPAVTSLA